MTLEQYRIQCGWSLKKLAREADVDFNTAKKAVNGGTVSGQTALKLAEAISRGLGEKIRYTQIEELKVKV